MKVRDSRVDAAAGLIKAPFPQSPASLLLDSYRMYILKSDCGTFWAKCVTTATKTVFFEAFFVFSLIISGWIYLPPTDPRDPLQWTTLRVRFCFYCQIFFFFYIEFMQVTLQHATFTEKVLFSKSVLRKMQNIKIYNKRN